MKLIIHKVKKGKTLEETLEVPPAATVADLKKAYHAKKKVHIHRQSFKKETEDPKNPLRLEDDSKTLESYGIKEDDVLVFKDLGPQVGYRTVFLVEYAGPLFIVLFYAMRPAFLYGSEASKIPYDSTAVLGLACWSIHFLKREFETIFVHRFSRPTMPLSNLFKNCTYYWAFGAVIGYPLCHPKYTSPSQTSVILGLVIFVLCELGNLICHLMLRNLRAAEGSKQRPVPKGFLFDLVSCPNYTFEVTAWVGFSLMTSILFSWAFTVVGFVQMTDWAIKKHKGYLKSYGDDYKKLKRKAIVPFIL